MNSNQVFIQHLLDEINFLLEEAKGLKYEDFLKNPVLKRAAARSLEIIGEAVKHISNELRKKHKDIEWRKIAGMRDKIIYYYFGVNWNILWDVIQNKLPDLKPKFESMWKTKWALK
jgi:uncharacterized protein with HEPN domain